MIPERVMATIEPSTSERGKQATNPRHAKENQRLENRLGTRRTTINKAQTLN
jgi:hypothetical protein